MILPLRALAARYGLEPMTRVLHVGGHYGEECDEYFREGAAHVTFFEPQSACFDEMARRIGARENVRLLRIALGNVNSVLEMHIETANAGQSSSLLRAKVHATQYPQIKFESKESVTVLRLDDCDKLRAEVGAWDFLAIDVQGYELEVFRGAVDSLRAVRAISAEINRAELYEGCGQIEEVDAFLGGLGYDRVETEWCGGTWGEGIYVRRRVQS
jgi:FkbM family methyltransferase